MKSRVDVDVRQGREAERLDPVARVRVERPVDGAVEAPRPASWRPCTRRRWRAIDVATPAHRLPEARAGNARHGPTSESAAPATAGRRPCRRRRRAVRRQGGSGLGVATTLGAPRALAVGRATRRACQREGLSPGRSALACRQTFTKRCTAVTMVSTSITHRTGTSSESKSRPKPRRMMRSARSMRPPRASKPSDSALARS